MEIREESGIKFGFTEDCVAVKFDDTQYYRGSFNALPESKGVDFITVKRDSISFIEVKNCKGDEGNCRWRIFPNNQKRNTTPTKVDVEGRNSLDIEVSQKVAMTLAALTGARTFGDRRSSLEELQKIISTVFSEDFSNNEKKKYVILFLEGEFGGHTHSKKMIMSRLQQSLNSKLRWMDCKVSVIDSSTYNKKIFEIVA